MPASYVLFLAAMCIAHILTALTRPLTPSLFLYPPPSGLQMSIEPDTISQSGILFSFYCVRFSISLSFFFLSSAARFPPRSFSADPLSLSLSLSLSDFSV